MVGPDRRATAISMMFAGLTVANVVGVPADTLLSSMSAGARRSRARGDRRSERGGHRLLVPQPAQAAPARLSQEIAAFGRAQVWLALRWERSASAASSRLQLHRAMMTTRGYSPKAVDLLLALFGLGMTVGNLVGGATRARLQSAAERSYRLGMEHGLRGGRRPGCHGHA